MITGKNHWALFFQQFPIIDDDLSAKNFGGNSNDDFENGVKHATVIIINNY